MVLSLMTTAKTCKNKTIQKKTLAVCPPMLCFSWFGKSPAPTNPKKFPLGRT